MALQGGEPGAMSRAVQAQAGQPPPSEVDRLDAVRIERLARIEQRQRDIDMLRQKPVELDVEAQLRDAAARTVQTAWKRHVEGWNTKGAVDAKKAGSVARPRAQSGRGRLGLGDPAAGPVPPEEPILSSTVEHMLRERVAIALERMASSIPTNADQFVAAEEAKNLLAQFQERRNEAARMAAERRRLMHETSTAISREEYWARKPLNEVQLDASGAPEVFIPEAGERFERAKAAYAACMAQAASSDKWWVVHKAKVAAERRRVMAAIEKGGSGSNNRS